jgi:hypothetical protein
MKRKNKLKIKKAYSGDFMTAETSSSMYDSGRAAAQSFQDSYQGGDGGSGANTTPTRTTTPTNTSDSEGSKGIGPATAAALSLIGKSVFDVSGLGLAAKYGKKALSTVQRAVTPQTTKDTADARLSGSFTTSYAKKTQPQFTPSDSGSGSSSPPKITLNTIAQSTSPIKKEKEPFFPFKAYNDGGLGKKFGPSPQKGPNPQVPPVKMKNGKMTKSYKYSCENRPDGIRGMGAALRGHKFTGCK